MGTAEPGAEIRTAADSPGLALKAAKVRPAKGRGQNFLVQAGVADRIVAAAALSASDEVVEVGPGLGILSERIARAGIRRFTLTELEPALAAALERRFSEDRRARIVCADFLTVELPALVENPPVKIVGNLPFNAATAILHRLCRWQPLISRMVLMFQREVAERIRGVPGERKRSALSVFTSLYWRVEKHFRVLGGSFHPRPKVDAEVIVFSPRTPLPFDAGEEAAVLATIRAAFSAPRKALRNSLAAGLGLQARAVADLLDRARIDPAARPASLATRDFIRIARALAHLNPAPYAALRRDA